MNGVRENTSKQDGMMSLSKQKTRATVLIASDNRQLVSHFVSILEQDYDVATACKADEMLTCLTTPGISVIIIDPSLYPMEDATDQILAVVRMASGTHVIVVENSPETEVDQHLLFKAGAHGFCRSDISEPLLRKAVELVLDGDYWVQRKLITQVISSMAAEKSANVNSNFDRTLVSTLTPRELQVAKLVHMGENNKMIARTLDISERTVKAHLSAIFRKLDIENRLNLALYFSELS